MLDPPEPAGGRSTRWSWNPPTHRTRSTARSTGRDVAAGATRARRRRYCRSTRSEPPDETLPLELDRPTRSLPLDPPEDDVLDTVAPPVLLDEPPDPTMC